MSMSECENSCQNGGSSRAMCLLPRWEELYKKWLFKHISQSTWALPGQDSKVVLWQLWKTLHAFLLRRLWRWEENICLKSTFTKWWWQETGTSMTARKNARRRVPRSSSKRTSASCPRRPGLASIWLRGTTSTSRWERARGSSLEDVKVLFCCFLDRVLSHSEFRLETVFCQETRTTSWHWRTAEEDARWITVYQLTR